MGGSDDLSSGDDGGAAMMPVRFLSDRGGPRVRTGRGLEPADNPSQPRFPRVSGRLVNKSRQLPDRPDSAVL